MTEWMDKLGWIVLVAIVPAVGWLLYEWLSRKDRP